ncbi:MAG: pilus assembly protein PilM [Planctomycetota bacterium]
MAKFGTGLEIDGRRVRVVQGKLQKGVFQPTRVDQIDIEGEVDARSLGRALAEIGLKDSFKPGPVQVGVTGKEVILRYTQVPPVPDWQLRSLMKFEIDEVAEQGGSAVSADFNLLQGDGMSDEDTVLLALARDSFLDVRSDALSQNGRKIGAFTPNAIALFNAYVRSGDLPAGETVLLVHLGNETTDLILQSDGELMFARNLSGGRKLFVDALAGAFGVSPKKAESLLDQYANLAPRESVRYANRDEERIANALSGVSGTVYSMLNAAVMFCRQQLQLQNLEVSRVVLSGPGGRLKGLDEFLGSGFRCPAQVFDPVGAMDLSQLDEEDAELLEKAPGDFTVSLGLAQAAVDSELYNLEILPEAERKKREFVQGPVFLIAAAILAVLFLAYDFFTSSSDLEAVQADLKEATNLQRARSRTERSYESTIAESEEIGARIARLEREALPGLGMGRTLALIQKHLPEDLWVGEVRTDEVKLDAEAQQATPVIVVSGYGKEGRDALTDVFSEFRRRIDAEPELAVVFSEPSTRLPFTFDMTLSFADQPPLPPSDDEEEDF